MDVLIRKGMPADIPAALQLVRELAIYERAPAEVEVTESEMEEWGFGPGRIFDFFVAEKDQKVVGMALYYYKYSTWKGKCIFLEDIIVTKQQRRGGIGQALFAEVVSLARKEKVRRLEWQVLEWNEPAIAFYKKYNSVLDGEWINCKLTYEQLQSVGS